MSLALQLKDMLPGESHTSGNMSGSQSLSSFDIIKIFTVINLAELATIQTPLQIKADFIINVEDNIDMITINNTLLVSVKLGL